MTGVKRTRRGVVVSFDEVEASLLRHLVGEVRDLLADGEPLPPPAGRTGGVPSDAELSVLTGLGTDPGQAVDVAALDPAAPSDLAATRYGGGAATVVEVLDPGLGHGWPDWDVMALAGELFERD